MKRYFSTSQAAKLLGVKIYQLTYAHSIGVKEPERVFGKRAYSAQDIYELANHFGVTINNEALTGPETEEHD
jgi:DNA-binding transcriptional MerR regulator